jgi:hypothetical protein
VVADEDVDAWRQPEIQEAMLHQMLADKAGEAWQSLQNFWADDLHKVRNLKGFAVLREIDHVQ